MGALKLTILTAAATLIVALAALAMGVPVPFAAGIVAKRFEAATGHRLESSATVVRLLPSLRVSVDNVVVLDLGEGKPQTRLKAERVSIAAPLSILFGGEPRLTEIVMTRPVLRAPLLRERSVASAPPAGKASGLAQPLGLVIDRLSIEDGAVEFADPVGKVEGRIEGMTGGATLRADRTLDTGVTARVGEQAVRLLLKGKFGGGDTSLAFHFEAPGLLQDTIDGTVSASVAGPVLTLDAVNGAVGGSSFAGSASVDFTDKPFVRLDLEFQRFGLAVVHPDAAVQGSLDQPWSNKDVGLEWLNYFDAEMQLSARELAIDRFRFAPVTVGGILNRGLLTGGISKTGVYGGEAQAVLAVDVSGAEPAHALRLDLTGVRALPLLTDVASFSALDGRMQARIDVRGRGANPRAVLSGLNGAVDLSVRDGELRTINIAKMIRDVGSHIVSGWQQGTSEKTDLTELSAFFRIDSGLASTDNFRLLGPLVRVTGKGNADIGAKTLQFRVEPKLVLSLQGQGGAADPLGLSVPVMVQGTWAAPRIYPDMAGILNDPDAAYAKLKELGASLLGSATGSGSKEPAEAAKPLMENIEALVDQFSGKDKPAASPPSASNAPRPQPARPRPSSPPQSQSQSQPSGLGGLFQGLFGR